MAGLEGRPAPPPHPYFAFPPIRGQNPWLDALRAIAVILVLLRHGERIVPLSDAGWTAPVHNLFINGWVGVDLFLVLSGYLITK
ncbi:MAG: acyltransferase family protein, partial [Pseudomonadota bacterium]